MGTLAGRVCLAALGAGVKVRFQEWRDGPMVQGSKRVEVIAGCCQLWFQI